MRHIVCRMDPFMMDRLATTSAKEKVSKSGQTALGTKVNGKIIWLGAEVNFPIKMAAHTKVNGDTTTHKDMAYLSTAKEKNMKVHGIATNHMAKASRTGKMEVAMKVNIPTVLRKDKGFID